MTEDRTVKRAKSEAWSVLTEDSQVSEKRSLERLDRGQSSERKAKLGAS